MYLQVAFGWRTYLRADQQPIAGQRRLHFAGGGHNTVSALVPHRPVAGPAAADVAIRPASDEVALQTAAAMRHGIGFPKAGTGDVPVVRTDRDLGFKIPPGLVPQRPGG